MGMKTKSTKIDLKSIREVNIKKHKMKYLGFDIYLYLLSIYIYMIKKNSTSIISKLQFVHNTLILAPKSFALHNK